MFPMHVSSLSLSYTWPHVKHKPDANLELVVYCLCDIEKNVSRKLTWSVNLLTLQQYFKL